MVRVVKLFMKYLFLFEFQKCFISCRNKYYSNLGVDFKFLVNNTMGCLGHGSIFYHEMKKKLYSGINTFLFGGVFGVFYAKK